MVTEHFYFRIDIADVEEGQLTKGDIWGINNNLSLYAVNILKYRKPVTAKLVQDHVTSDGKTKTKIHVDTPQGVDMETLRKMAVYLVFYVCVWRLNLPVLPFVIETEHDT